MNANRAASSGDSARTASWNAAPVMPAIRWSLRIASGGASDRTTASASSPVAATTGS